jgi:hypothetical protein
MPGNFNDYLDKIKNRRTQIEYSNSFEDDKDIDEENFDDDLDEEGLSTV